MDVKLENLIEKLRKEGVDGAQKAADEIIAKAEEKAGSIVDEAGKKAESVKSEAEESAAAFQKNSERAIQQAARDVTLSLRQELTAMFDSVFRREVSDQLDPEFLKKMILKIAEKWSNESGLEVEASEKDIKELEKVLFKGVKKEVKEGINLKPKRDLEHGFYIGIKGKDLYYDFSDESISETLKSFLNKRLNEILDGDDG